MDWQDLTEKLKKMGVQLGSEKNLALPASARKPIEEVVDGRELATIFGSIFASQNKYPQDYVHGKQPIQIDTQITRLSHWAKLADQQLIDIENLVFLDTETTGLSGGTGTMAFMVGAARFQAGQFVLEQFFVRNPAEELAMLAALDQFCHNVESVVTYNGKSFDIPVLNTRYTLNRLQSPFEDLAHFDLLHITRRIWKARLEKCNLGVIEKEVLGLTRDVDDIPGYLVPEYYREYLADGNSERLKGIFYHNKIDVISLAALMSFISAVLENPLKYAADNGDDLISVAKVLEILGLSEEALCLYDRSLIQEPRLEVLMRKAALCKRKGDWNTALDLWKTASEMRSLVAVEEIAKYYEHIEKNIASALEYTVKGIALISNHEAHPSNFLFLEKFQHRQKRLTAKIRRLI